MGRKIISGWSLGSYGRGLAQLFLYALRRKAPPVWVALGAALSFYGLASLPRPTLFGAVALAGISTTFLFCRAGFLRDFARIGLILSLGIVWGAAAALSETARSPPAELSRFVIEALRGEVAGDSRRTASGNTIMPIRLERVSIIGSGFRARLEWPRSHPLVLLVTDGPEELSAGQKLGAERLSAIDPGQALFFVSSKNILPGPFVSAFARFRGAAKAAFSARIASVSGKAFPLAQALLLGVKDEIDSEEARLFRAAGCAHILALSGQHLSILCMLMTLLFAKLLGRADIANGASLLFAASFTWLAGAGPSLLRAMLMSFAGSLCRKLDRPQEGVSMLALVFCVAIGWKPSDARSLSFTLSYAAMLGLLLLSPRLEAMGWRLPSFLAKPLSASIAALCATSMISLSAFGSFATGGIVAATLSGPVILVFMWSLLGSTLTGAALPFLRGFLSTWHETLHSLLIAIMRLGSFFPMVSAEAGAARFLIFAAIVALSLFVYAYPYGEYAIHALSKARGSAKFTS